MRRGALIETLRHASSRGLARVVAANQSWSIKTTTATPRTAQVTLLEEIKQSDLFYPRGSGGGIEELNNIGGISCVTFGGQGTGAW